MAYAVVLQSTASLVLGWATTVTINHLNLREWRRSADEHWSERARLLWPVRVASGLNVVLIPACVTLLLLTLGANWHDVLPIASFGMLGTLLGGYWFAKALRPALSIRDWLLIIAFGLGRRALVGVLILVAISAMPNHLGMAALVVIAIVVVHVVLSITFSRLLIVFGVFRPPDDRLRAVVARSSLAVGKSVPVIRVMNSLDANAYANRIQRELYFTVPLLAICTDDEIAAVCAHELAHLDEPLWSVAVRLAGHYAPYLLMLTLPLADKYGSGAFFVLFMLVVIIVNAVNQWSRRMEQRADSAGTEAQFREGVYAQALEKIHQENSMPAVLAEKTSHPNLYDRMVDAGVTPSFERPDPPSKQTLSTVLLLATAVVLAVAAAIRMKSGG